MMVHRATLIFVALALLSIALVQPAQATPPPAPTNLQATTRFVPPAGQVIELDWDMPPGYEYAGMVYFRSFTSGGPYGQYGWCLYNCGPISDSTCPLTMTCYYVVVINGGADGWSAYSNEASGGIASTPLVTAQSCAVYNSTHGNPFPGQDGLVLDVIDGTHLAACAGLATPAQCGGALGVVVNNALTCLSNCTTNPGPGWSVGAVGVCRPAPWIAVYPAYPACPPSASVGVVVYAPGGSTLLSVCL